MKKKYVAVMLGLVLSMSTASVYAAGNSAATAAESTDSSSDSSNSQQGEKNQTASRQQGRNRTENHRRVMDREDLEVHLADRSRQLNIKSRKSFP